MATAQKTLLSAAASVLKTIAAVEGTASAEWEYARAALIALSDQTLTNQTADQLLSEAQPFTATSRNQFDEEQRLVLLRIAIDIATADGTISTDEETALINLGKNLGFDETLIKSLIQRLRGGSTDNEVAEARKVLRVTPEATIGEIRSAYKKLMLKHHPDRVEAKEREEATRISADINAAYDLLIGRNQTKK
jgi:DnaJ-domain-containing protein 1